MRRWCVITAKYVADEAFRGMRVIGAPAVQAKMRDSREGYQVQRTRKDSQNEQTVIANLRESYLTRFQLEVLQDSKIEKMILVESFVAQATYDHGQAVLHVVFPLASGMVLVEVAVIVGTQQPLVPPLKLIRESLPKVLQKFDQKPKCWNELADNG